MDGTSKLQWELKKVKHLTKSTPTLGIGDIEKSSRIEDLGL